MVLVIAAASVVENEPVSKPNRVVSPWPEKNMWNHPMLNLFLTLVAFWA